ncbi:unnamed protein product, partial [Oppiella nova]
MKGILFAILVSALIGTSSLTETVVRIHTPLSVDSQTLKMVEFINNLNTTWKAQNNFEGYSLEYIKGLMGVHKDNRRYRLPIHTHDTENLIIPDEFDSRTQWPNCPSIS